MHKFLGFMKLKLWKYDFRMGREFTGHLFQLDVTDEGTEVKEI